MLSPYYYIISPLVSITRKMLKLCYSRNHLKTLCNSCLFNFQNYPNILMLAQLLVKFSSRYFTRAVKTTPVEAPNCLVMQGARKPFSHSKLHRKWKGRSYCWYPYCIYLMGKEKTFFRTFGPVFFFITNPPP